MKTLKSLIIIAVSMFFVVGLCSQGWAKKQDGPTPGPIQDRGRYCIKCSINWSAPDSLPKPGSKILLTSKYLRIRFKAPCPGNYFTMLRQDGDVICNIGSPPVLEQGEYFDRTINLKKQLIGGKKLKIGSLVICIGFEPVTRVTRYCSRTFYNTIEVVKPIMEQK